MAAWIWETLKTETQKEKEIAEIETWNTDCQASVSATKLITIGMK